MTEKVRDLNGGQLGRLYTFEVAARHASFAEAAAELALTPSAVSHRISQLEEELNIPLFIRSHRKVRLTEEGERIFTAMSATVDYLNREIQSIRNQGCSGQLTVYCRPSFAHAWLVPALPSFFAQFPLIDVIVKTGNEQIELHKLGADLAISFDATDSDRYHQEHLLEESIFPVCSPLYARRLMLDDRPENLAGCRLLHDRQAWGPGEGIDEWKAWATHFDVDIRAARNTEFDQSELAVTAAVNHAGVAMGRKALVERRIASGELVAPFPGRTLRCAQRYYISTRADRRWPKVDAFIRWLKAHAR
ncbi:DNA-binding transcriptional regulator DsdC [Pantoea eucrina]|uniref:DNA-binding transcriptional regulator DsdC n=1 Tax=Pantoea eucrina TaxID=472693 RepID=A0ABU5LFV2_9GAMM|nr:DNA-binding transcriptional regulator DsdC [Pantoea eucrina]MDZ7278530.1 DNA-binding transcriptional regulator DsdC [Pantoea eucrina]